MGELAISGFSITLHLGPCVQTFHSDQLQEDMWLIYEETHSSRERPVPLGSPILSCVEPTQKEASCWRYL